MKTEISQPITRANFAKAAKIMAEAKIKLANRDLPSRRGDARSVEPEKNDPIVALALAMAAADVRVNETDVMENAAKESGDLMLLTYLQADHRNAEDILYALKESLHCFEANSIEGAMVQIAEAYTLVDFMSGLDPTDDDDKVASSKTKRAIERLLTSALHYMERTSGRDMKSLGLGFMRNTHMDPWELAENRAAAVKAKRPDK